MNEHLTLLEEVVNGRILQLTINRPQARNAFDLPTAQALDDALTRFDQDPALRVAVITGAGGTFSAGQDLKAAARGEMAVTPGRGALGITRRPPEKPIIAAVEGYALGGGLEIALACDLVVAAEDSILGLPEVRRGLAPLAGGVVRVAQRVPAAVAADLLLTGRQVSAAELHKRGLITSVTPAGESLTGALELARQIAANGPFAVRTILGLARTARQLSDSEVWQVQDEAHERVSTSADAKEGLRAFLEKRDPVWAD